MTEAILTALGLILGVAATLVSLLHDETPSRTKMVLSVLALLGLGAGLIGTRIQYKDRVSADAAAADTPTSSVNAKGIHVRSIPNPFRLPPSRL
jgi:hypothetical protein